MDPTQHHQALEALYRAAPINRFFEPHMTLSEGRAEITSDVRQEQFHTAGALHGSAYFKLLDDACFFASNSLERERFVLTASFTTYLLRPVSSGRLRSIGRVVHATRSQYLAEAELFDAAGELIAKGSGTFVRGPQELAGIDAYASALEGKRTP